MEISQLGTSSYVNMCALRRQSIDFSDIENIIHSDFIDRLHSGSIKFNDKILIRCSSCGEYMSIKLGRVIDLDTGKLLNNGIHLCRKCNHSISSYEEEICSYIAEFYHGTCIRNARNIISPLELDLYYPEKNIAIEFNGDYWHSDKFKSNDYHYNKFYKCLENNTVLVSIFSYYWNKDKHNIKQYLKDLFEGNENMLSFDRDKCINNNYPVPCMSVNTASYSEDYYTVYNYTVYTCGYSPLCL